MKIPDIFLRIKSPKIPGFLNFFPDSKHPVLYFNLYSNGKKFPVLYLPTISYYFHFFFLYYYKINDIINVIVSQINI